MTTPSTLSTADQWRARAAVEITRLGSAGLSATHYALLGLVAHPAAAVGLGIIAGALDYAKGTMLAVGLGGRGAGFVRRSTALALGGVLLIASVFAVDGVLMRLRAMSAALPADVISRHDDARDALDAAKAELAKLAQARTESQVRADMDHTNVGPKTLQYTKHCTDFAGDLAAYRKACKPLLALRVEMADAIRKGDLEARQAELQAALDTLGPRPTAADPQATAIASVSGLPENAVLFALAAIIGLSIEGVSCFGRYVLERPSADASGHPKGPGILERFALAVKGSQPEPSAGAPLAANHPALLVNASKGSPDGSANGSTRGGGAPVVAFPVTPKRPSAPNGSTAAPVAKGSEASQREDFERRENVLAFLREEAAVGNVIDRQAYIGETLGIPGSSLSELMSALEAEGAIVRRQDGRRKVITVSQRAFETA